MKKTALFLFLCLFGFSAAVLSAASFSYKFPARNPLVYKVALNGDVHYNYGGTPNVVTLSGNFYLNLLRESAGPETSLVKVTATRSRITVNGEVLEDTTASETKLSNFIPVMLIEFAKNGKILKNRYNSMALFDFVPFLNLFPVFPEKVYPGAMWTQTIPSFNFPSVKLPALEFNYIYQGKTGNLDKFGLVANQIFNETRLQKGMKVHLTGLNSSKGGIYFNAGAGAIEKAAGQLNVDTHFTFTVPDVEKTGKTLPLPLNVKLLLNFSFLRLH